MSSFIFFFPGSNWTKGPHWPAGHIGKTCLTWVLVKLGVVWLLYSTATLRALVYKTMNSLCALLCHSLQGLMGPPGPEGAEGKPGTQVPILYRISIPSPVNALCLCYLTSVFYHFMVLVSVFSVFYCRRVDRVQIEAKLICLSHYEIIWLLHTDKLLRHLRTGKFITWCSSCWFSQQGAVFPRYSNTGRLSVVLKFPHSLVHTVFLHIGHLAWVRDVFVAVFFVLFCFFLWKCGSSSAENMYTAQQYAW